MTTILILFSLNGSSTSTVMVSTVCSSIDQSVYVSPWTNCTDPGLPIGGDWAVPYGRPATEDSEWDQQLHQAGNGFCPIQLVDKDYQGRAESLYCLFNLDGHKPATISGQLLEQDPSPALLPLLEQDPSLALTLCEQWRRRTSRGSHAQSARQSTPLDQSSKQQVLLALWPI